MTASRSVRGDWHGAAEATERTGEDLLTPSGHAAPTVSIRDLAQRPGVLGLGLGQAGQALGRFLTLIALTVGVARLGHDHVFGLAALFVFLALPTILIEPFLGPLVEGWNKRTAMIAGQLGKAASLGVIAFFPGIWTMALAGLLMTLFHGIYLPAYRSVLSGVAQGDEQVRLTSLIHTATTAMQMVGVGLGGAIAVLGTPSAALGVGALAFAASAAMELLVPRSLTGLAAPGASGGAVPGSAREPSYMARLREGIRAVADAPLALRILLVLSLVSVSAYILNPVLVLMPGRVLHIPLWWYPVFEISQGLFGVILGGVVSSGLPLPARRLIGFGLVTMGLALVGLAVSRSAVLDVAIYGVIGLSQMAVVPAAHGLYRNQFSVPVRSRASATLNASLATMQAVGAVLAGVLAHGLGVTAAVAAAGVLVFVAAAVGAVAHLFGEDRPVTMAGPAATGS